MIWRAMEEADADVVTAISDAVHGDYTEPRAVFVERRDLFPEGCFVLEKAGDIVGYLITHPWCHDAPPPLGELIEALPSTADSLHLHDLALLPVARGTGEGATATRMAIEIAKANKLRTICLLAVSGADAFWFSQGFTPVADTRLGAALHARYGDVVFMSRSLRAAA